MSLSDDPRSLSVVIAVLNEADNVEAVAREAVAAFAALPAPWEIVFVDDGSTDDTAARILGLNDPRVRLTRHSARCGKSQALRTGVVAATGRWIATMDGDGQNDPKDIVVMAERAWTQGGSPLVAGVRTRRHDPLSRRIATKIGNGFRQMVLDDGCPDTGCGLKLFERAAFLRLPIFEGAHRFFPALFKTYGHPLINVEVNHRARASGSSKYTNIGRALVGIVDVAGVVWLRARTKAPPLIADHDQSR
ncbi:MAG: glycosyltransferase [Alphaproteobacteria bacterium]|nr:glycosyltransferase [Alphaproteobacteria bacterium]